MKISDLQSLRAEVSLVADKTAHFIRNELHNVTSGDIEEKEMNSLVSYVDKQAEEQLIENLEKIVPGTGFITEEETVERQIKDVNWIIDPLDGTTNYLHKIPHFSISIALDMDGIVLGVVHDIMQGEIYSGIKGGGAFLGDQKIQVSQKKQLSDALIVTGFPYTNDYDLEGCFNVLRHLLVNARGIRRLGSAALDLAYVASGKIEAYYEGSLNIWDLAAGALIVEEAGGKVTDYQDGDSYLQTGQIIASNTFLHESVLEPVRKFLEKPS